MGLVDYIAFAIQAICVLYAAPAVLGVLLLRAIHAVDVHSKGDFRWCIARGDVLFFLIPILNLVTFGVCLWILCSVLKQRLMWRETS